MSIINSDKEKRVYQAAKKMGIKITMISKDDRIFEFSYKKVKKLIQGMKLAFNCSPATVFAKDKGITKLLLARQKISVPRGIHAAAYEQAIKLMNQNKIKFPVVVKPLDAAKGEGVFVDLHDKRQLKNAITKVKKICAVSKMKCSGEFIVEEMVSGRDYRVLVLDGRVIAACERVHAYIIGDGRSSIKKLIDRHNIGRPKNFLLKVDTELLSLLKNHQLTLQTVLSKGEKLQLRKNANISSGGIAVDMTDKISGRFKKIAVESVKALGLRLGGVDLMTEDITNSSSRAKYWIIEINGAPQYEIHDKPIIQKDGVNVVKILLQSLMSK